MTFNADARLDGKKVRSLPGRVNEGTKRTIRRLMGGPNDSDPSSVLGVRKLSTAKSGARRSAAQKAFSR